MLKLTKPGLYGAQAEDAGAYVQRWDLHNRAFGDDVAFEGLVTLPGEHAPRAVISQRVARGRDATDAEMRDYLVEKGFHEAEDNRWIHPVRGIVAWDTITPGNMILTDEGVRVVDLQLAPAPSEELARVREETGIGRQTSFSIGMPGDGNTYDSDDTPRKPAKKKYVDRAKVIADKILRERAIRSDSLNAPEITPMPEDHQLVGSRVEIILVHSRKGDLLVGEVGGTGNIGFDARDYPADAITTHNHPSGKPPSATDLLTTLENPGWMTRVVTLNEKGNLEVWVIRAKGDFPHKERKRLHDFYYDEKGKYGDTALARKGAIHLTLERFGHMIDITSKEFPHEK